MKTPPACLLGSRPGAPDRSPARVPAEAARGCPSWTTRREGEEGRAETIACIAVVRPGAAFQPDAILVTGAAIVNKEMEDGGGLDPQAPVREPDWLSKPPRRACPVRHPSKARAPPSGLVWPFHPDDRRVGGERVTYLRFRPSPARRFLAAGGGGATLDVGTLRSRLAERGELESQTPCEVRDAFQARPARLSGSRSMLEEGRGLDPQTRSSRVRSAFEAVPARLSG